MIHRVPLIVSPRNGFVRTVGAPSLGTITDLAAIPGNGQIALSWTPAAHATSHQPQYREQGSGTWLSFGGPLSGTASGVTVTGLTPGTPYEARVVASDGVSQTFSNMVTATPVAPGSGATPFFEDDFESYNVGSTVSGGGNSRFTWVGSRETRVSNLISHSGTRSLCFRYDDTPEDNHIWAEQRFSILGEPLKEVWIEYYLYYPDGTEGFDSVKMAHWDNPNASDNNKFYRLWGGGHSEYGGNPGKVGMSTRPRNGGPDGHIFFEYTKHGSSGTGPFDIGTNPNVWTWEDDLGRWIRVRMYYKHVSAPGAADAHFTLWKDDQVWIDAPNVDQAWVPEYPHWDSGYIFGADNSHIGTYAGGQILIFLDDYKMYDQDPGWTR